MNEIPSTWINATDDICPRPSVRHVSAEVEEPEDEPIRTRGVYRHNPDHKRKPGSGKGKLDLTSFWKGKFETEREWLISMLRVYRTAGQIGQVVGYSKAAVSKRIKDHKIPVVKGWHGGLIE